MLKKAKQFSKNNNECRNCPDCGKLFSSKSVMKSHQVKHTKMLKFTCMEKEKLFQRNRSFNIHKSKHTCDAQFKCKNCGQVYEEMASLTKHVTKHTVEKPTVFIENRLYECTN